jgi:hypothetical protein
MLNQQTLLQDNKRILDALKTDMHNEMVSSTKEFISDRLEISKDKDMPHIVYIGERRFHHIVHANKYSWLIFYLEEDTSSSKCMPVISLLSFITGMTLADASRSLHTYENIYLDLDWEKIHMDAGLTREVYSKRLVK